MPALEMHEVRKVYEQAGDEIVALDHATVTVADDEILALVGPSGSGKTTLISIAGGLLSPTDGAVVVGGADITGFDARRLTQFRREQVGFVFQAVNLVPFLTARENVMVAAELAGRGSEADARRRADRLLGELGLAERRDNLPAQLSGGERQRVAIGRALMNEPKLVLVDEPTSALDTRLGEQVMQLIVNEVKGRSTAAVVVTHDTRMTHFCDRVVEITDGRLQAA
jgi:putative ABC transport system ATP-binding protein